MPQDLEQKVKDLEKKLDSYIRRPSQEVIRPATIKARHMGEGVPFIQAGTAANRPSTPNTAQAGVAIYFATDTFVLSVSTGTAWKTVTLS